jgi:hypothetical protein
VGNSVSASGGLADGRFRAWLPAAFAECAEVLTAAIFGVAEPATEGGWRIGDGWRSGGQFGFDFLGKFGNWGRFGEIEGFLADIGSDGEAGFFCEGFDFGFVVWGDAEVDEDGFHGFLCKDSL